MKVFFSTHLNYKSSQETPPARCHEDNLSYKGRWCLLQMGSANGRAAGLQPGLFGLVPQRFLELTPCSFWLHVVAVLQLWLSRTLWPGPAGDAWSRGSSAGPTCKRELADPRWRTPHELGTCYKYVPSSCPSHHL